MITTTHGKAYAAFMAIVQIRNMVKGMDALHAFHMKNALKDSVDFIGEEEIRLVEEFGGVIAETGQILIPDKKKQVEYIKARKQLDDMPCEIQTEPIRIRIDRCPDVNAEQVEALDGFVIFEEEEENGDK